MLILLAMENNHMCGPPCKLVFDKPDSISNLSQGIQEDVKRLQIGIQEIQQGVTQLHLGIFIPIKTPKVSNTDKTDQKILSREQKNRDILAWMSPFNFITKHKDLISKAQEGTGKWFLDCEKFKQWASGNQSLLLCSGQRKCSPVK